MTSFSFTVPGEPQGKARARTVRNNGITRTFTPETTQNYEALVKLTCQQAKPETWGVPEGEIGLNITAYFAPPKSVNAKKRAAMLNGSARPTKKPDWDNMGKVIGDALNGIAYHDDSQVVCALVMKQYAETPGVHVTVSKYEKEN